MAANPTNNTVKLSVTEGIRKGKAYAVKEGTNYVGRKGPHEVNVDLTEQENPGVAVKVNRFAAIWFNQNGLAIADTGRGITFVNGVQIPSGKRVPLNAEDIVRFGQTSLQVVVKTKVKTGIK